jgi:hypothetical protein
MATPADVPRTSFSTVTSPAWKPLPACFGPLIVSLPMAMVTALAPG